MLHDKKYWSENWLLRANNYLGLSQRMKDLEWVGRQELKGRLTTGYKETIQRLMPVLEAVYPGKWDIQFSISIEYTTVYNSYIPMVCDYDLYNAYLQSYEEEEGLEDYLSVNRTRRRNFLEAIYTTDIPIEFTVPITINIANVYIVIHFPEITITNSSSESLIIKDLFTRTTLGSDGTISSSLFGTRSTFTVAEMCTGYVHSHLHSIPWTKLKDSPTTRMSFTKFCLGESDLITFTHLYNGDKDLGNFESYLHMLKTVVSWESLEGGPHVKMSSTVQKQVGIPNISVNECLTTLSKLIEKADYNKCNIDWVFRDGEYLIVDNEKFEDFLRTSYPNAPYEVGVAVYKDETGKYFIPTSISTEALAYRHVDFVPFRGQKFQLKIEGELKLLNKHKWYINPKIKQYVKSKLESVCNKIEIKEYTIGWLNQSSNNGRISQQSQVSV